jgi:p21-activated kinase 1
MVEGEPPHRKDNHLKALHLIATNRPSTISNPENVSALFKNYLSLTLTMDAEKRPTASELLQVSTACPSGHSEVLTGNVSAA